VVNLFHKLFFIPVEPSILKRRTRGLRGEGGAREAGRDRRRGVGRGGGGGEGEGREGRGGGGGGTRREGGLCTCTLLLTATLLVLIGIGGTCGWFPCMNMMVITSIRSR